MQHWKVIKKSNIHLLIIICFIILGHTGEIVSLHFNAEGDKILTGSFDRTAMVWDTRTGECIYVLDEHVGNI